jgi:ppGpp synthetase/RelA/SpoT-type nucleotidyltranferase
MLEEYQGRRDVFHQFTTELVGLLGKLLPDDIAHSVNGRTKELKSLETKISRADKSYQSLDDVSDLAGVRIIVYFADHVDLVADMVRREFEVDAARSVDKRKLLDPDRFGYLSLHYVVGLNDTRSQLAEYRCFRGCKAEIQIRSILQHSWAEIEHDLDYKSIFSVPREIRRDFSRVAGLLELADSEFVRIRESLDFYRKTVGKRIEEFPEEVYIDKVSLVQFATDSELVKAIDEEMAEASGVVRMGFSSEWIEKYVDHLYHFGVTKISDLERELQANRGFLVRYARERLAQQPYSNLLVGVSISYLPYALAGQSFSASEVRAYFENFKLYNGERDSEVMRREVAELVIRLMKEGSERMRSRQSANLDLAADGQGHR